MAASVHTTVLEAGSVKARAARLYAEALVGAAMKQSDADAVDTVGEELNGFVANVLGKNPKLAAYLASPAVGRRTKGAALAAALAGHSSDLFRGLVNVLLRNNRLDLLAGVAEAYNHLLDQRAGRVRVRVRAASELSDAQRTDLAGTLAAVLKQQPILDVRVEPELLGGMVVQVGDRVIDTSVRTRLETLRTLLLDKGSTNVVNQR